MNSQILCAAFPSPGFGNAKPSPSRGAQLTSHMPHSTRTHCPIGRWLCTPARRRPARRAPRCQACCCPQAAAREILLPGQNCPRAHGLSLPVVSPGLALHAGAGMLWRSPRSAPGTPGPCEYQPWGWARGLVLLPVHT